MLGREPGLRLPGRELIWEANSETGWHIPYHSVFRWK